jgi:hypothetical protein
MQAFATHHRCEAGRSGDASFPLLVRVAFCRRQIPTELLGGPARAIAGRVALDAPSFSERAGVHDVEAELINETADGRFRRLVISRDDQTIPIVAIVVRLAPAACSARRHRRIAQ